MRGEVAEGGREGGTARGGVCMRLIDNHRQVVSSEKGAVDTSARYHQRRVQKADPSSGPTIQIQNWPVGSQRP